VDHARVTTFRLLGPLTAERDGRPIELGGPKLRSLLGLLLLDAGRVVSIDRITEALWGANPPPSATASLQAFVSNLRRALRDERRATSPIVRRAPGYLLDVPPTDIDLTVFLGACDDAGSAVREERWADGLAAARQADGLVRGGLLPEFADEEWVRIAAVAVDERHTAVRQDLVHCLLGTDQVVEAVALSGRLFAAQPLAERSCWLHMIALYRAGRPGEALEAFRAHARALDDELGLEIGPALRDMQAAVLRQDRDLQRWPARALTDQPGVVEPPPSRPDGPAPVADPGAGFVGRERETAVLADVLAEARSGARWVLLTGTAGIGKSRLAERAAELWSAAGGRVARTRCPDDEGVPPWWPVRRLLRELGHDPDEILQVSGTLDADTARYAAYDRLLPLLADAAREQPLLIAVDDVHWADPMTLRFLTFLVESLDVAGLAVVLTSRTVRPGPDLGRLLAAIARRAGSRQLQVPPLSTAEVAALATAIGGQPVSTADARRITARTGGNPFFVGEYARLADGETVDGDIPVAIRAVLRLRLAGLDPDVVDVLEAAAVIGATPDLQLVGAVARLDRDELADLLDEAADAHILVADPATGNHAFAHALLRDEILAGLPATRRQRLNARVARAIGSPRTGELLGKRAAHLVAALPMSDAREALDACRAAAADAESSWQSDAAADWWQLALDVLDRTPDSSPDERDDVVVALVTALARAGRSQTVLETVDAALLDAVRRGRTGSAGRLASVLLRTSGSWPWVVFGSDPGPLLERLDGLARHVTDDPAARSRILGALAVGRAYDADAAVHRRWSAEALELAEQLGDPDVLADALLARALTGCSVAASAADVIATLGRLAALPHADARVDDVIAQGMLFSARTALGDPGAAEHVRRGAAGSDLLRLPVSRMQMRWAEAEIVHGRGDDLREAEAMYDNAIAAHRRTELYESAVHDMAGLALRWDQGRLAQHPELADAEPGVLPWAAAMVAAAHAEPAAAELVRAEIHRGEPLLWTTLPRLTMLAHAVADLRMRPEAAELRERLEPSAGLVANIGMITTAGPVAVGLARLCHLLGDSAAAREHLATAVTVAERIGARAALVRCALLAAEFDAADGLAVEPGRVAAIAAEATARGLDGIAAAAEGLARQVGAPMATS
jgi:DNA-binding SARP family transcriptional activator